MAFFIMEYRVNGYALSDGLRPDPKWGKRTFTVDSCEIGTEDLETVKEMAIKAAPPSHYLFSIYDRDNRDNAWCGGLRSSTGNTNG